MVDLSLYMPTAPKFWCMRGSKLRLVIPLQRWVQQAEAQATIFILKSESVEKSKIHEAIYRKERKNYMKENIIKVVKVEVGEPPVVKEIENSLKSLQNEVGGFIECIYLDDGCIAVVNEEGKINGMEPNRRMGADIICGPFFICGDGDENFASLTDEQIEKYSLRFTPTQQFTGEEPELEPHCEVTGFNFLGGM